MIKKQKCSEIQLILHVVIIFVIGVLIGTSLVSETDELISDLKIQVEQASENFENLDIKYSDYYDQLMKKYKLYKQYVYSGVEIKCTELNNYYIDNSQTEELTVELIETFNKPPQVFISINGFYYNPHLALNDGQSLEFRVGERNPNNFKIQVIPQKKDDSFRMEDFDRIDICYIALVHYEAKDDLQKMEEEEEAEGEMKFANAKE